MSSIQMTGCSLAILLLLFVKIEALQPAPFKAGMFSNAAITTLAKSLGGEMGGHLEWFADTAELFTFPGHDGLPLQGYHIPAPVKGSKRARGALSDVNSIAPDGPVEEVPLPVLIHCAGWSETTIKYSKFLRILNDQGYSIYSFDMRGQGFSSATGHYLLCSVFIIICAVYGICYHVCSTLFFVICTVRCVLSFCHISRVTPQVSSCRFSKWIVVVDTILTLDCAKSDLIPTECTSYSNLMLHYL